MTDAADGDLANYAGLDELLAGARVIDLPPGATLLRQGEASAAAYFLTEGTILVYAETAYGETPLAPLAAPRLIGEIGALAGLPRTASIRAQSRARLLEIDRAKLVEFGRRSPELLLSAVERLGRQIDAVNKALALYANALTALEERGFDSRILADLDQPPPALAAFSAAFRRFAAEIVAKRRQQDEMASAALIQQSVLPKDENINRLRRDVRIAARIRPAREIGGDFYDFFLIDDARIALVIGDVCGKGAPASLFASIVVTVLRTLGRDRQDVAAVIDRANILLCEENDASMFATVFFGVLDLRSGELSYCNCGHVAPFLVTADGDIRRLRPTGLPLAIDAGFPAAVARERITPGDKLVMITDGVTEANNAAKAEFGERRLLEQLGHAARMTPAALLSQLFSAVDAFAQGEEQADDIGCLVVERPHDSG